MCPINWKPGSATVSSSCVYFEVFVLILFVLCFSPSDESRSSQIQGVFLQQKLSNPLPTQQFAQVKQWIEVLFFLNRSSKQNKWMYSNPTLRCSGVWSLVLVLPLCFCSFISSLSSSFTIVFEGNPALGIESRSLFWLFTNVPFELIETRTTPPPINQSINRTQQNRIPTNNKRTNKMNSDTLLPSTLTLEEGGLQFVLNDPGNSISCFRLLVCSTRNDNEIHRSYCSSCSRERALCCF